MAQKPYYVSLTSQMHEIDLCYMYGAQNGANICKKIEYIRKAIDRIEDLNRSIDICNNNNYMYCIRTCLSAGSLYCVMCTVPISYVNKNQFL